MKNYQILKKLKALVNNETSIKFTVDCVSCPYSIDFKVDSNKFVTISSLYTNKVATKLEDLIEGLEKVVLRNKSSSRVISSSDLSNVNLYANRFGVVFYTNVGESCWVSWTQAEKLYFTLKNVNEKIEELGKKFILEEFYLEKLNYI